MTTPAKTQRDRVIDAVMDLVAETGWRDCSFDAVALRTGLARHALYREFDDPYAVVAAAARRLDAEMLAATDFESDEAVRDRLFALLMARFDGANPWRQAIARLGEAAMFDPRLSAVGLRSLHRTASRALAAAGVTTGGLFGPARVAAFATGVLLPAARVWLHDESEDLARTMADLDRRLARAERWAGRLGPLAGGRAERSEEAAASKPQPTPEPQPKPQQTSKKKRQPQAKAQGGGRADGGRKNGTGSGSQNGAR